MYRSIVLAILAVACCQICVQAEELTGQQVKAILAAANAWKGTPYKFAGKDRSGIDCSHFVHAAYSQVLPDYKYRMAEDYLYDREFTKTITPQPGDLIVFTAVNGLPAHVGIVTDPEETKFIGAQSSTGVKETSYAAKTYWGKRPYRFLTLQAAANFAAKRPDRATSKLQLVATSSPQYSTAGQKENRSGRQEKKPRFTLHPLKTSDSNADPISFRPRVEPERRISTKPRQRKPVTESNVSRDTISQAVAYRVNIEAARLRLPELIKAADQGTEVIIRDDHGNSFRLVPIKR
jgi:lipoprotein Spr